MIVSAYLSTSLAWILSLFELLVTFLVRFIVTPKCESFGAHLAGDGPAAAEVLAVLTGPEIGTLSVGAAK